MATTNWFLKLDGIDGESVDEQHKGWIEVESWSWGVSNPANFQGAQGGNATQAHFTSIDFTKTMDRSSVTLWQNATTGKHIRGGTVSCMKLNGEARVEYLKIELTDVLVTNIQIAGAQGGDTVDEHFSLQFAKFHEVYNVQQNLGTVAGGANFGWDLQASKLV